MLQCSRLCFGLWVSRSASVSGKESRNSKQTGRQRQRRQHEFTLVVIVQAFHLRGGFLHGHSHIHRSAHRSSDCEFRLANEFHSRFHFALPQFHYHDLFGIQLDLCDNFNSIKSTIMSVQNHVTP
ncbi:hypothetical protein WR25_23870 [Diploscapter pachys]|uniref:Uncharacterized protein n=1 Tax=Diploscapter pachys TaxID=2018661 RepID=A0A2A2JYH4_9BILA|nr:hypothetical protein WR25_23870 [Diploscapter pachys]